MEWKYVKPLVSMDSIEKFEELSKEYGSTRFTFSGNEYKLVNGENQ